MSKEYDPILMGEVRAIPECFTIYEKIVLEGPLTFEQFFAILKEKYDVNVTLVSSGKCALFNSYLPGNKHSLCASQDLLRTSIENTQRTKSQKADNILP